MSLPRLLQVLIAVISDVFDRLQERRESAYVKGQATLIREIELVFGSYPRRKSFLRSIGDPQLWLPTPSQSPSPITFCSILY